MGSFPISYRLGPLTFTIYGLGLALSFVFAYWLLERRLIRRSLPHAWVLSSLGWVALAAIIGARVASVAADWSNYRANPLSAVNFLHGGLAGLSSFGGLVAAVPTAIWLMHRRAHSLGLMRALDVAVPTLVATWGLARLIACQFMLAGGGPRTNAWYGLVYAGQSGKRVPVPLFQSAENWFIFGLLLIIERWWDRRNGSRGLVAAAGIGLWGLSRATDEWLFFLQSGHGGAVATTASGLALFIGGLATVIFLLLRHPTQTTPSELSAATG